MSIGTALREARQRNGIQQYQAGALAGYSDKMVSAIETGKRAGDIRAISNMAQALDDGELLAAIGADITGGVFVQPPLDGQNVDLHRCAVLDKAIEEAEELVSALKQIQAFALRPEASWIREEAKLVEASLHEAMEAEGACEVFIRVFAHCIKQSLKQLYAAHLQKLHDRKYIA